MRPHARASACGFTPGGAFELMKRKLVLLLCLLPAYHLAPLGAQAAEVFPVRRDADGVTLKVGTGTLKLQVFSPA